MVTTGGGGLMGGSCAAVGIGTMRRALQRICTTMLRQGIVLTGTETGTVGGADEEVDAAIASKSYSQMKAQDQDDYAIAARPLDVILL